MRVAKREDERDEALRFLGDRRIEPREHRADRRRLHDPEARHDVAQRRIAGIDLELRLRRHVAERARLRDRSVETTDRVDEPAVERIRAKWTAKA